MAGEESQLLKGNMKNEEVHALVTKYFTAEGYTFPTHFEHRFDPDSSAIMYAMVREFKPKACLEIGPWLGGSTSIIMTALQKNGGKFTFVCSELEDDLRAGTEQNVKDKCKQAPKMIGDITKNLDKVPKKLDFLFVDTNHDREVTEWIVENIWPRLVKGGLFIMHDWAVWEEQGKLLGKGEGGTGALPETEYLLELIRDNKFPFEKVCWTFNNPMWDGMAPRWETAVWKKV